MRIVDMEAWPRRKHFEFFRSFSQPHFNLCAPVDVTAFYPAVKRLDVSFTAAWLYVIARTANEIPEFRYRIRGDSVVEHEVVHPSTTILAKDDLFGFCYVEYAKEFRVFAARAAEQMARARECPSLEAGPGGDDQLFMTAMPWVSFTGVMHPLPSQPPDSVPRFAWGKFFDDGGRRMMPLSVQAHHALVDGLHAGRFYEGLQEYLNQPAKLFGEA